MPPPPPPPLQQERKKRKRISPPFSLTLASFLDVKSKTRFFSSTPCCIIAIIPLRVVLSKG